MIKKTLLAAVIVGLPSAAMPQDVRPLWSGVSGWESYGDNVLHIMISEADCPKWCPAPYVTYRVEGAEYPASTGTSFGKRTSRAIQGTDPYRFYVKDMQGGFKYTWMVPESVSLSWDVTYAVTSYSYGRRWEAGESCKHPEIDTYVPVDLRVGETARVLVRTWGGTCAGFLRFEGRSDDVIAFAVDELVKVNDDIRINVTGLRPGNVVATISAVLAWE